MYLYKGKRIEITADQIAAVRAGIGDTQVDFAKRFRRSRWSVIRWEAKGTHFYYQSVAWAYWHGAVSEACHQHRLRTDGADDEQAKNLQALRTL